MATTYSNSIYVGEYKQGQQTLTFSSPLSVSGIGTSNITISLSQDSMYLHGEKTINTNKYSYKLGFSNDTFVDVFELRRQNTSDSSDVTYVHMDVSSAYGIELYKASSGSARTKNKLTADKITIEYGGVNSELTYDSLTFKSNTDVIALYSNSAFTLYASASNRDRINCQAARLDISANSNANVAVLDYNKLDIQNTTNGSIIKLLSYDATRQNQPSLYLAENDVGVAALTPNYISIADSSGNTTATLQYDTLLITNSSNNTQSSLTGSALTLTTRSGSVVTKALSITSGGITASSLLTLGASSGAGLLIDMSSSSSYFRLWMPASSQTGYTFVVSSGNIQQLSVPYNVDSNYFIGDVVFVRNDTNHSISVLYYYNEDDTTSAYKWVEVKAYCVIAFTKTSDAYPAQGSSGYKYWSKWQVIGNNQSGVSDSFTNPPYHA